MINRDQFTQGAQDGAARALEICNRYGHNQVDTEHILLAYLEQPEGVLPQILEKLSVEPEPLKQRVNEALSATPRAETPRRGPEGQVFITPRVFQIINQANEEATRLNDEHISTEHLFRAIVSERDTPAARILSEAGITQERIAGISGLTNT